MGLLRGKYLIGDIVVGIKDVEIFKMKSRKSNNAAKCLKHLSPSKRLAINFYSSSS